MTTYNENHTPTLGMVEDLVLMAISSVKSWTTENVDKTEIMKHIKEQLDIANRTSIGSTAAEKCQYLISSITAITNALRSAGAVIGDDTPLAQFATLVTQISATGYKVCILGKSGTQYSAAEWRTYIEQHGSEPEDGVVIAVLTPFESFVIGLPDVQGTIGYNYPSLPWGNTTDNVTGLYSQQTGSYINVLMNSLEFHALENTRRMLLWYDPEVLPHCNYDPNDPDKEYGEYGCVRFATKAEMVASGQHLMYDQQVYIVTNDESDSTTEQCYYWSGTEYVKRFAVPRVANNITGSPAAKRAWNYKAWNGETRQYALPTTNHLLMMYVYQTAIDTCMSAINRSTLPAGYTWTCQQGNANFAWYVAIPSANVNFNSKSYAYAVVPVAAL